MSDATTTYPHLVPAVPHRTGFYFCDVCFEGEHADIIAGRADALRPMFRDVRDGCVVCEPCAMMGAYLEIEEEETSCSASI